MFLFCVVQLLEVSHLHSQRVQDCLIFHAAGSFAIAQSKTILARFGKAVVKNQLAQNALQSRESLRRFAEWLSVAR